MRIQGNESGFLLVETIVSLLLFGLLLTSFLHSQKLFMNNSQNLIRREIATELAMDKIEELKTIFPTSLSDDNDLTETVTRGSFSFARITDITVNSDGSRSVSVTVVEEDGFSAGMVTLTSVLSFGGMS